MKTKVSLDTNILLDDPEIVFDSSREFVISFTVIRELDKLKRNPDLKRIAQSAINNIWTQYESNLIEILNIPDLLADSPDERIIQDTKEVSAKLLSNDIGARIIAKAHGVEISDFSPEATYDESYTGYTTIQGDADYEKHYVPIKEMSLEEFNEIFQVSMKENEYCIIQRGVEIEGKWQTVNDKEDIWYAAKGKVSRISQGRGPLSEAGISKTPLDSPQFCALHAVMQSDVPLTVIDGKLGTGSC